MIRAAFRPLFREAHIFYLRWALRDMQRANPCHPDLNEVVITLRDLLAERYSRPCFLRSTWRWL